MGISGHWFVRLLLGLWLACVPCSALTVSVRIDGARVAPAQPVYYWISYHNATGQDDYLIVDAMHIPSAFEVADPEGNRLDYVGGQGRLPAEYRWVRPGETVVVAGNLSEAFRIVKPGIYGLRINYANERPESLMDTPNCRNAKHTHPVDPSRIVRGSIMSDEVLFSVDQGNPEIEALLDQEASRTAQASLSSVISDNADRILERYPESPYAATARATKALRLVYGLERPGVGPNRRFPLAAEIIRQLESKSPTWYGFPYLYAHAIAQAGAKGQKAYADAWAAKLRERYPNHPALIWLANRRAETGADRPTK